MKSEHFAKRQQQPVLGQLLTTEPMTKREFMQQYVLNRATGHTGGLDAVLAAETAEKAWAYIEKVSKK